MNVAYLTGTNTTQLDITGSWFLPNLAKHTDVTILCYDFGLDVGEARILEGESSPRRWRVIQDGVAGWKIPSDKYPWFFKPDAIQHALLELGYDKVIWIDNDVEVRGSFDHIFDTIETGKLMLADDWYASKGYPGMKNTGVVGACAESLSILEAWIWACEVGQRRGDQEALYSWLQKDETRWEFISHMPIKYNTTRLHIQAHPEVEEGAVGIHWTGPVGKAHIRDMMND